MEQKRPALMLPMGKKDYENGIRMDFLRSCRKLLDPLGWTVGIEARGLSFRDWFCDCSREVQSLGGRVTYHLPDVFSGRGDPDKTVEETLTEIGNWLRWCNMNHYLELATIHLEPIVWQDPLPDAGLERYNSPIDAEQMLAHLNKQIHFLRDFNRKIEGILSVENTPLTNFREAGHRLPTFLSLRAGSWLDIAWLRKYAGVKTTFDVEHFLAARNLLMREGEKDLCCLPRWEQSDLDSLSSFTYELNNITGYWLKKGLPLAGSGRMHVREYIDLVNPDLFHLGAATRDVDEKGRIASHLPIDINLRSQWLMLNLILAKIQKHNTIGAVVEVCGGNFGLEEYDPWSPRLKSDEVAKFSTFLNAIDVISGFKK